MKRFASKLFSKLTIGATIIILQFGWFVYLIYSAKRSSSAANMALEVCAVALALYISNKDMRTSFKMSWIFLVLFRHISFSADPRSRSVQDVRWKQLRTK